MSSNSVCNHTKQLLDEAFVISRIIKVEVEIMHRGHTWHDYPWRWVSLTWLLYNLQLDDVPGADFEVSLYALGQSKMRESWMYNNRPNWTLLDHLLKKLELFKHHSFPSSSTTFFAFFLLFRLFFVFSLFSPMKNRKFNLTSPYLTAKARVASNQLSGLENSSGVLDGSFACPCLIPKSFGLVSLTNKMMTVL